MERRMEMGEQKMAGRQTETEIKHKGRGKGRSRGEKQIG